MNTLDLAILMAKHAADGSEPIKAFSECSKAGMTGVKRDSFESKYAEMVASPLMRKLAVRTAREDDFKDLLAAVCLLADPPEEHVIKAAQALAAARANPAAVSACLDLFAAWLTEEQIASVRNAHKELWP